MFGVFSTNSKESILFVEIFYQSFVKISKIIEISRVIYCLFSLNPGYNIIWKNYVVIYPVVCFNLFYLLKILKNLNFEKLFWFYMPFTLLWFYPFLSYYICYYFYYSLISPIYFESFHSSI
jgi:hypothetical protein